ncbi:hypothetical protein ANCDUO_11672 [Ancylostoma duodenale]|uniref:Uncharacterized protein n=1 Tax=Ancylostoma duodenale TaxID=51022 RepID=A0A0C2CN47_9BILA|nr:hypothetical protein ANCDUO_11672 [Ancylostoma duodenale]
MKTTNYRVHLKDFYIPFKEMGKIGPFSGNHNKFQMSTQRGNHTRIVDLLSLEKLRHVYATLKSYLESEGYDLSQRKDYGTGLVLFLS